MDTPTQREQSMTCELEETTGGNTARWNTDVLVACDECTIRCPEERPAIAHGKLSGEQSSKYGTKLTVICDNGYALAPEDAAKEVVSCEAGDVLDVPRGKSARAAWSVAARCVAVDCGALPPLRNAQETLSEKEDAGARSSSFGVSVSHACRSGHVCKDKNSGSILKVHTAVQGSLL